MENFIYSVLTAVACFIAGMGYGEVRNQRRGRENRD